MSKSDDKPVSWNFDLNFENRVVKPAAEPPRPPVVPPRVLLREKYPHIQDRIELIWGSIELHRYLSHLLTTDRPDRQGFPEDVIKALGDIFREHRQWLIRIGVINEDPWDITYKK